MNENLSTISHNIRFLRKKKGINQEQLAQLLVVKRSNIAAYEAKNVEPRLRIILNMAKLFNIDLEVFLQHKLEESSEYAEFGSKQVVVESVDKIEKVDKKAITEFVNKSAQINKILIGFKTFYNFRKTQLTDMSTSKKKILSDIDNFINLMDHLLAHNETMIKAISTHNDKR